MKDLMPRDTVDEGFRRIATSYRSTILHRVIAKSPCEAVDLKKCAADLKSRTYEGPEWLDNISERVRRCAFKTMVMKCPRSQYQSQC
jgi:hypothetical protein